MWFCLLLLLLFLDLFYFKNKESWDHDMERKLDSKYYSRKCNLEIASKSLYFVVNTQVDNLFYNMLYFFQVIQIHISCTNFESLLVIFISLRRESLLLLKRVLCHARVPKRHNPSH